MLICGTRLHAGRVEVNAGAIVGVGPARVRGIRGRHRDCARHVRGADAARICGMPHARKGPSPGYTAAFLSLML